MRRGWRGLLIVGVSLVLFAALYWLTRWLWLDDDQGAERANVLALPVAVVGAVLAGLALLIRPAATDSHALMESALTLLDRVMAAEATTLNRLLGDEGDPRPADVGFTRTALLRWRADGSPDEGSLTSIAAYYEELDRGRLVVLGAAGAGKTVLISHLLLDLARRRFAAATGPAAPSRLVVPVRLNLSAFTEEIEQLSPRALRERLRSWIAEQLTTHYGLGRKSAAALVERGWLTPILDGLDDMDPGSGRRVRAAALLAALNVPAGASGWSVVLTCRSKPYTSLANAARGKALQDATVVELQPLTSAQIVQWLTHRFPDPAQPSGIQRNWQPVVRAITEQPTGRLAACLANPLRLYLAITAYQAPGSTPKHLCTLSTGKLENHLLSSLIPAVTEQLPRKDGTRWDPDDVTRWLGTCASHLALMRRRGASGTDLHLHELWHSADSPGATGSRVKQLTANILSAVAVAPLVVLLLLDVLTRSRFIADMSWIIYLFGLAALVLTYLGAVAGRRTKPEGWRFSPHPLPEHRQPEVRIPRFFRRVLVIVFALLIGTVAAVPFSGRVSLAGVLALLSVTLVATGELLHVSSAQLYLASRPSQPLRTSLWHDLVLAGMVGLGCGTMVGLMTGGEPTTAVLTGIFLGLPTALGFRIASSPWPRYAVAVRLLARSGALPARPAQFLDWAYEAGLVRMSGIAVQFRHRDLQEHLTPARRRPAKRTGR